VDASGWWDVLLSESSQELESANGAFAADFVSGWKRPARHLGSGLLMLTMYRGSWIETLFGVDPDQGSGAVEGLVVTTVLAVALASAFGARQEWRRSSQG